MIDRDRLTQFARQNRRDPGLAEVRLWSELANSQLGVRFRRQHPIGPFIADFACRPRRIVVEVDDASHQDLKRDARRDDFLIARRWHVLHVADYEVFEALDGVLALIRQALTDPASLPNPVHIEF